MFYTLAQCSLCLSVASQWISVIITDMLTHTYIDEETNVMSPLITPKMKLSHIYFMFVIVLLLNEI